MQGLQASGPQEIGPVSSGSGNYGSIDISKPQDLSMSDVPYHHPSHLL